MKLVIKGATIIDRNSPYHGKVRTVTIVRGKLDFSSESQSGGKMIDARGMYLTPGWVDMWCWLADPGFEHKESIRTGIAAASAGGFTAIAVLPNNDPVTQSKNDIAYLRNASTEMVDILPMAAATRDLNGTEITEMIDLHHAGAVAFTDGLKTIWHSDILLKSLQYLQKFDGLLINRPEDQYLSQGGTMHEGIQCTMLGMKGIPSLSESITISRDLDLLRYAGGRIHFNSISTKEGLALLRNAKKEGLAVTCDMPSFQTAFVDEDLYAFDTSLKVNPPFRGKDDRRALIKALKDGIIDVITSGHIPQDEESKKLEFDLADFGIIGLQTVAPSLVALSNEVPMDQLLDKVSVRPREILNLNRARIDDGEMADLTLFDPAAEWTLDSATSESASRNTPFWGQPLKGKVVGIVRGNSTNIIA